MQILGLGPGDRYLFVFYEDQVGSAVFRSFRLIGNVKSGCGLEQCFECRSVAVLLCMPGGKFTAQILDVLADGGGWGQAR